MDLSRSILFVNLGSSPSKVQMISQESHFINTIPIPISKPMLCQNLIFLSATSVDHFDYFVLESCCRKVGLLCHLEAACTLPHTDTRNSNIFFPCGIQWIVYHFTFFRQIWIIFSFRCMYMYLRKYYARSRSQFESTLKCSPSVSTRQYYRIKAGSFLFVSSLHLIPLESCVNWVLIILFWKYKIYNGWGHISA
jgi:hypothetical protein